MLLLNNLYLNLILIILATKQILKELNEIFLKAAKKHSASVPMKIYINQSCYLKRIILYLMKLFRQNMLFK